MPVAWLAVSRASEELSSATDSAWSVASSAPLEMLAFALAAQTWPSAVMAMPPQPQMPPPPAVPSGSVTVVHE